MVKDNKGAVQLLDVSRDVIYIQTSSDGTLVFHTEHEEYRLLNKVEEWSRMLRGLGYLRVDRGTIVNMNQAWQYDDKLKVLKIQSNKRDGWLAVSEKAREGVIRLVERKVEK
ncbi:LytTR family transcriptional regulator [Paenibacillus rhizovicinus]|uniref:LytTR family transcriptional regulator n=1 Tax=Paenibacillus rhizovicinus TaxID=2704463 RepID=A0A6C0NZ26_9BACL|nr:LytTR family transcriptional regulator DNA-binding domain-containing protein [Paenibacillus rhizovicinus]QHW31459.1 LytTR family transcriptional regulator [Paenibacillus rhizovicinus]